MDDRIREQTHTANIRAVRQWNGNAIYEGTDETFRDTDFHAYLNNLGIERINPRSQVVSLRNGSIQMGPPAKGISLTSE